VRAKGRKKGKANRQSKKEKSINKDAWVFIFLGSEEERVPSQTVRIEHHWGGGGGKIGKMSCWPGREKKGVKRTGKVGKPEPPNQIEEGALHQHIITTKSWEEKGFREVQEQGGEGKNEV